MTGVPSRVINDGLPVFWRRKYDGQVDHGIIPDMPGVWRFQLPHNTVFDVKDTDRMVYREIGEPPPVPGMSLRFESVVWQVTRFEDGHVEVIKEYQG